MITKGKPRGVPFKPGTDPRRNLAGSSSREKQSFKAEFRRMFDEEVNVRKIVRVLLKKAEQGVPWAIQEVLDRGLGKPTQSLEVDAPPEDRVLRIEFTPTDGRPLGEKPGALPSDPAAPVALLDAPGARDVRTMRMPRPGLPAPEALTDAELDAEIARLEAEGGDDEPAS